jgi:MFS family permease
MGLPGSPGGGVARRSLRRVRQTAVDAAGGPARARVALTLVAVLGLNGADTGTISSTTDNLERAFGVGNTQIGLLLTVVGLVGAAFTIPVGVLTDRTRRAGPPRDADAGGPAGHATVTTYGGVPGPRKDNRGAIYFSRPVSGR